jgi:23S rRNA (adenine2503-C2)-methyltransferase
MVALKSERNALLELSPGCLLDFVKKSGAPLFRARQLSEWIYKKLVLNPDKMLNLPKGFRQILEDKFICCSSKVCDETSAADGTAKLLIELADGEAVEMVLIPSPERMTFCLSTQVGCPVRCRFCASGAGGLTRNLQSYEILEQLYHGAERIGGLPDNIVFMGIGEGLLNFENLSRALIIMTDPEMIGMSPRRLTVSTSGFVPGIYKLAKLGKSFNLAVSLHAVDDDTRSSIIPDDLRYPISEILDACDVYQEEIGRMVTFEYTLLKGINDRMKDASKLAEIAVRHHAKINLIPYNQTCEEYQRPDEDVIYSFRDKLEKGGASVTLRMEKGSKVSAACGQLRASRAKN